LNKSQDGKCLQYKLGTFKKGIIGKYIRKYGSFVAKSKRSEETKIITRITNLSQKHPDSLLEDEKLEMALT